MSYNQNKFKFNLFNETINIKSIIQKTDKSLDIIFDNLDLTNKENKEDYIRLTIDEMAVCNTNEVPLANPKQTFELDKNSNGLLLLPNNELLADLDKNERPYIKTIIVETSKVIVEFNIAVQPNETPESTAAQVGQGTGGEDQGTDVFQGISFEAVDTNGEEVDLDDKALVEAAELADLGSEMVVNMADLSLNMADLSEDAFASGDTSSYTNPDWANAAKIAEDDVLVLDPADLTGGGSGGVLPVPPPVKSADESGDITAVFGDGDDVGDDVDVDGSGGIAETTHSNTDILTDTNFVNAFQDATDAANFVNAFTDSTVAADFVNAFTDSTVAANFVSAFTDKDGNKDPTVAADFVAAVVQGVSDTGGNAAFAAAFVKQFGNNNISVAADFVSSFADPKVAGAFVGKISRYAYAADFVKEMDDASLTAADFVSAFTDVDKAARFVYDVGGTVAASASKNIYDKGLQAAPLIAQGTIKLNTNTYLVNTNENAINHIPTQKTPPVALQAGIKNKNYTINTASILGHYEDVETQNLNINISSVSVGTLNGIEFTPPTDFTGTVTVKFLVSDADNNSVSGETTFLIADE